MDFTRFHRQWRHGRFLHLPICIVLSFTIFYLSCCAWETKPNSIYSIIALIG